ncbi:OpgC family protein [Pararhodobacter zhoushanensis]|uniref:OpgC domain-containing protein n=1 Tax=Pararhodobacter zhoushanensis TaxID=2479545 RepID=A0ABT3GXU7_9RHOB|nr:OpgC domain-containing protein [Pararhodobacter zhoushanensis]MCW1932346.1 OpgC domain-containing protein [Pararhodobacter zhoushanensis]
MSHSERRDPVTVTKRARDPRIDAFRGLALVMIFIDHVPGNPFEYLTIRNLGFSDAAESFFILSGIAAGLAYSGRFLPEARLKTGLWSAVQPMWSRAWVLYLMQIFMTLWAIAIFSFGAQAFDLPQMLTIINLRQVFENTEQALLGIPLLTHQLGYVNILPAYSVLLFVGPALIVLGLRHPVLLVALSAAVWLAAGIWRLNLPNYPNPGGWFFNPVAWQAVFVAGLLTGIHLRKGERFVPRNPYLFAAALGYLVLVVAWRYLPGLGEVLNHQMARLGALGVPFNVVSHDKTYLALPRFLHVLAMFYVLSCLPVVTRVTAHALAAPLRLMGRQGLLVFVSGTLLALVFQVIMTNWEQAGWLAWVLPPLGVAGMIAIAWVAEWQKALRKPKGAPVALPARRSAGEALAAE